MLQTGDWTNDHNNDRRKWPRVFKLLDVRLPFALSRYPLLLDELRGRREVEVWDWRVTSWSMVECNAVLPMRDDTLIVLRLPDTTYCPFWYEFAEAHGDVVRLLGSAGVLQELEAADWIVVIAE